MDGIGSKYTAKYEHFGKYAPILFIIISLSLIGFLFLLKFFYLGELN